MEWAEGSLVVTRPGNRLCVQVQAVGFERGEGYCDEASASKFS